MSDIVFGPEPEEPKPAAPSVRGERPRSASVYCELYNRTTFDHRNGRISIYRLPDCASFEVWDADTGRLRVAFNISGDVARKIAEVLTMEERDYDAGV